ncbi:ATP synthase subunit 5, mitochondrial [Trichomonascus vanleenenianus]|uniref:F1F0 ATP synthase subunit 5 n=1 Tax=Trichomonascus vanleenenianus TaxID=2268995 RepID=UPI003EC9FE26
MFRLALRQTARGFATKAAISVKPPVQLFGIDGTYATALYSAAVKNDSFASTEKVISSVKSLIEKDTKLATIIASPTLSAEDKKVVVEILSKATNADQTVSNFFTVLAENDRLGLVADIARQFEVLSNAHHGVVEATVTSAEPLDKKTLGKLESILSTSKYGQGKTLKLVNNVKPDILGGLVVEIGNETVDVSVSNQIGKLNKLLTETL